MKFLFTLLAIVLIFGALPCTFTAATAEHGSKISVALQKQPSRVSATFRGITTSVGSFLSFKPSHSLKVDKEKGLEPGKRKYTRFQLALIAATIFGGELAILAALIFLFLSPLLAVGVLLKAYLLPTFFWYLILYFTDYPGPLYTREDFEDIEAVEEQERKAAKKSAKKAKKAKKAKRAAKKKALKKKSVKKSKNADEESASEYADEASEN